MPLRSNGVRILSSAGMRDTGYASVVIRNTDRASVVMESLFWGDAG